MSSAWFYLSFSGQNGWRGCAIVKGDSVLEAVEEAWRLGVNPGGEVAGVPIPEADIEEVKQFRERLLGEDELKEMDEVVARLKGTEPGLVHGTIDELVDLARRENG